MKTALYLNKPLFLPKLSRDKWHKLYLASKQGNVFCIHCGNPVKMNFGIHEMPEFSHTTASHLDCHQEVMAYEDALQSEQETAATTVHGFRLPSRQTIKTSSNESTWKEPVPFEPLPPYKPRKNLVSIKHPYRQKLKQANLHFDESQWEAVQHKDGPLLLLAGAGSGKTRVLTARAAYMLCEENIPVNKMALVTFTAKAAHEMKDRMSLYPGVTDQMSRQLLVRTFHSLFVKMLNHFDPNKWHMSNLLKWPSQLVKEAGLEMNLDESEFAYDHALTQISWWKNQMISPDNTSPKDPFEEKAASLYKRYEEKRETVGLFDFDDMLTGCFIMLQENPSLLSRYQERFAYLSVDEFQDINKIQFEIIKMLAHPQQNVCVVGDDDQSIYAFRGSDPYYIQSFKERFSKAKIISLVENYRSSHQIIAGANQVIEKNIKRIPKQLIAQRSSAHTPFFFFPYNEEEEATMIVEEMSNLIENGATPDSFAILYRTNVSVRAIVERLIDSRLPFSIDQDLDCFYERKIIRKALSFLRIGLNEEKQDIMRELLQALFVKQEKITEMLAIQRQEACTLLESLSLLSGLAPFQQKKVKALPAECRKLQKLSPEKALETIEQELGFRDTVKKQGQEGNKMDKGSDDFRQLKVVAGQYETVQAFLEHVDHIIANQSALRRSPKESNAIQLMTIHRSKGLEYKHVFIAGCVERGLPHEYALDALREGDEDPMQEERRLMYVAMTRAKERLSISIPIHYRGRRSNPSRFLRPILKSGF
ncbi:UvrD-helicase domain-containing protein [Shouchella patagoniensis]|uniref:UvrD-helicase domain-containing protein n=1 Tax=Shouchella patagoniensis TaxID=228576 RepID=UPI000994F8FF|nr:ATP-dependent helicase [Shouchella patagoniensis]